MTNISQLITHMHYFTTQQFLNLTLTLTQTLLLNGPLFTSD